MEDYATIFAIGQLIYQCSEMDAVVFQACPKRALLARGLVTWQAMEVHYIFQDIVGRVAQHLDERCHAVK